MLAHQKLEHKYKEVIQLRRWVESEIAHIYPQVIPELSETPDPQLCQETHIKHLLAQAQDIDTSDFVKSNKPALLKSHYDLYGWWMKISKRWFFQLRTQATKALDQAIQDYSLRILDERIQSLEKLLVAVDVWKQARKGKSSRYDAVELLHVEIAKNIEELKKREPKRKARKMLSNQIPVDLSIWWDNLANEWFDTPRSPIARVLDQAIQKCSDNYIVEPSEILFRNLLSAIELWRETYDSESAPNKAVAKLYSEVERVTLALEEEAQQEKEQTRSDTWYPSFSHKFMVAFYFLQDFLLDIDTYLEFFI